ncbi:MAG TPA: chorismate mutase [Actinobacteria bacterium]|nr:chorismate mutase [Actinomycetota bacterium]
MGDENLEEQLSEHRKQIDFLDDKIIEKLNERARIVLEIREIKNQANLPILDSQREQEIMTKMTLKNNGPLGNQDLQEIYRHILHYMRNFE